MSGFGIFSVAAGGGELGLCPMPGRDGAYAADLAAIRTWNPVLVLTMATAEELSRSGAAGLPADLVRAGIGWRHLPVDDYGADSDALRRDWPAAATEARAHLAAGRRVLAHCMGGCGRSGMAVLRLMVELGEDPDRAIARLRDVRYCAVETPEQFDWASAG